MKNIISLLLIIVSVSVFAQQPVRPEKKIIRDSFYLTVKVDQSLGDTVFYENRDIVYSSGEASSASQFAGGYDQPINYKDTLRLLSWYGNTYISAHDRLANALKDFYNASEFLSTPRELNRAVRSAGIIPVQVFVEQNLFGYFVEDPNVPESQDVNLSPGTRYRLKIGANAYVNHTMHVNKNKSVVLRNTSVNIPVNIHSTKCLSIQIDGQWQMLFNIESNLFESLDRSIKLQRI